MRMYNHALTNPPLLSARNRKSHHCPLFEKRDKPYPATPALSYSDNDRVYFNADMLVDDPKIVKIGQNLEETVDEIIDATDKFVYPGLIMERRKLFTITAHTCKHLRVPFPDKLQEI